jgi:nitrogenase molybdenum-iron protein alpha/beta subunit
MPLKPLPSNSCRFEGCTLTGALSVTTSIRDSASVVHGPAGCAHHNFSLLHTLNLDNDRIAVPRLVSSGMLDTEVVFGGEDALRTAIRAAVSQDARSVFVLSSCIAETIGDDVAAVCGEGWDVPVLPVATAGFLGGSFQKGVNNALTAIAGMAPVPAGRHTSRVNIIGEKNLEFEVEENYAEVVRLLTLLGLDVNMRFVHQIGTDELARLGTASFNILRDEGLEEIGHRMLWHYGIPSIPSFPAGFSGTVTFLNRAARACRVNPAGAVAQERALQASVLDEFSDLRGSSIAPDPAASGGTGAAALWEVIGLLGMNVTPDGTPVPLPFDPPVGTNGITRLLHRWRRALHA